jgi:hypothetical protein
MMVGNSSRAYSITLALSLPTLYWGAMTWIVSYQDIENWTGIKFNFIFENSLSSPLLADSEGNIGINSFNGFGNSLEFLQGHTIPFHGISSFNFSGNGLFIGQFNQSPILTDTVAEAQGSLVLKFTQPNTPSEINIFKNNTNSLTSSKDDFSHICSSEIGIAESTLTQIGSEENSISKITSSNLSPIGEINITKVSSLKNTKMQGIVFEKTRVTNSLGQQFFISNPAQIQPAEIQSTKVSLPSLVSSQQLFSGNLSHDNTSLLTSIYSTARSIWHTNTDLNLTFAITNLPTGQLAEATITGYNPNGTPNTATITLDDDGNGLGWFIDSTPQDNSEFGTSTGTYFTANPDS